MPTGYTADVVDGKITDVTDFAANCARGFGAFMHMRDENGDAELHYPKSPYDSYYVKALDEARSKKNLWYAQSEQHRYCEWSTYYTDTLKSRVKSDADNAIKRTRYDSMIAQVEVIDVPEELKNFKDFMLEQLNDSKKFDTHDDNDEFTNNWYRPKEYAEWCADKEKTVNRDVDYYTEELDKDWERYENQLAYIDQMIKTFGFKVKGGRVARHPERSVPSSRVF